MTGGADFRGSHLVAALLDRGEDALRVNNLFIGTGDSLANYRDHPRPSDIDTIVATAWVWQQQSFA